jgi:hypothetical protein
MNFSNYIVEIGRVFFHYDILTSYSRRKSNGPSPFEDGPLFFKIVPI